GTGRRRDGVPLRRGARGRRDRVHALERRGRAQGATRLLQRGARISPASPAPAAEREREREGGHRHDRDTAETEQEETPAIVALRGRRLALSLRTRLRRHGRGRIAVPIAGSVRTGRYVAWSS